MVDWVVVLTPLLALAVVLLLGFAGCKFEHGTISPTLTLRARVPTALTVTEIVFRWTPPGGGLTQEVLTNPTATGTDGADSLYHRYLSSPPDGAWATSCRVAVQEGSATASAGDQGDFTLDGTLVSPVAVFQASGAPSTTNFAVNFVGVS